MDHKNTLSKMTLEEKIALCSGKSFWQTKDYPQYGIPSLVLCDGPHGLRKQEGTGDHLGLNASKKSTCFPTASANSAAWDVDLLEEMGRAIGLEAIAQGVNVVLGPGVNMKRNPLCGRNFEYFSEDPYLSGKLAAAWIRGVQSTGTGTSLKHFALNNQEQQRMVTNVLVDERALREYYLPAFEIAAKEAVPATVMCAYNRIEGVYCSDSKRLLRDILREEWGFAGAVITDWGATVDRIEGFRAGMDLEMPGSKGRFDEETMQAVSNGALDEACIDAAALRVLTMAERTTERDERAVLPDLYETNHKLAHKVALASAVLLKNEDAILPLENHGKIAVIGELARTPRYQGTGSSQVVATTLVSLLDGMQEYAPDITFEAGYTIQDHTDEALKLQAMQAAKNADTVIVCIGLTDIFESEGFDREHMRIPQNQIDLLTALANENDSIVIVLSGGSAIEMPWAEKAKAILHMQLPGQAGGRAAADLLFGKASPCGRLTESYPYRYADVASSDTYNHPPELGQYMESMFCGYRYFVSSDVPVRYPFGYGLSYTSFSYSNMKVVENGDWDYAVSVEITNVGERSGAEIVQLYVEPHTNGAYRPKRELKAFAKAVLAPKETATITMKLDKRSFAIYSLEQNGWIVERGEYALQLGKNCMEMIAEQNVAVDGVQPRQSDCADWYYRPAGKPQKSDFLTIHAPYGEYVPNKKGGYTLRNSIVEMKETSLLCRIMYKAIERMIAKGNGGKVDYEDSNFKMLMYSAAGNPIGSMPLFSPDQMPLKLAQLFVASANGHTLRGLVGLLKKNKVNQ